MINPEWKLAAGIAAKSEHDINPRNFIIPPQIILKFHLHVYLECSFASFKLFMYNIENHMTMILQKFSDISIGIHYDLIVRDLRSRSLSNRNSLTNKQTSIQRSSFNS